MTADPHDGDQDDLWDMATHDRANEAFHHAVRRRAWAVAAYAARVVVCSGSYSAASRDRAQRFLDLPATDREGFRE